MNTRELKEEKEELLLKLFRNYFPNTQQTNIQWEHAVPLLSMLVTDRGLAKDLKSTFHLIENPRNILKNLKVICERFAKKSILHENKIVNPYFYRLPLILGEYPRHSKVINHAIQEFNLIIEKYYLDSTLDVNQLNACFLDIVNAIALHGAYCFPDSLAELINMMHGYSCIDLTFDLDEKKENTVGPTIEIKSQTDIKATTHQKKNHAPVKIISAREKNIIGSLKPFIEENAYIINRAGRLMSENSKLAVNGFGLKFGGHFDALLTHTPTLIQIGAFYSVIWRELSQRMELPQEESDEAVQLRVAILTTLKKLGMVVESITDISDPSDYYISPFNTQPLAFMTPSTIKNLLEESVKTHQLRLKHDDILILSDYMSQILYRMQFNISEALGIGANDDNTVSFSHEGRDYIFQFDPSECDWAERFALISLQRQGPAQPLMNAAKGVQYELAAAFLAEIDRMNQLQRSEYIETIYNAIIDNLVTDLFPHPDFFENTKYKKYRKQYFLSKDDLGRTELLSYLEESDVGIFKENGQTTPRFRRAGTIDVHPLPKDHGGVSEASQSMNDRNPLAAKQFQYAEALQNGTRGHYVYNPVGPDSFIVDIFGGQVIKNNDGSFLPFIGKIPKNFDKEFKQSTELCASFVIRMLHSSRLLSHCPTFLKNYLKMKADFLPNVETIPALPSILEESIFLKEKMQALKESLSQKPEERDFDQSEKLLLSLFKNIVYQLRTLRTKDANFSVFHYHLVNTSQFVKTASRANLEKVIRMLKINAPVKNDMDNKDFLLKVTYLENLIQAFYPVPSVETARRIQKMAAIYKKPFTIHKDIQDYFKILQNSQANLSRRQSPGMLFTKLRGDMVKHKRTLAEKRQDFDRMHQKNFLAGYRDPEGSMVVQPTKSDQFLDFAAKGVAKFAVGVQHDSNPLGHIITAPFISAYNGGKNNYATDAGLANFYKVPLGLTGGLLHGVNDSGFKAIAYSTKFIARPGIRAKDAIEYYHSKIDTRTTTGKLAMAGVFIPAVFGIVSGMLESIFKLIYDCTLYPVQDLVKFSMAKVYDEKEFASIKDHPLYIPALPDNEPGFKVKMSDQTRDILLASTTQEMLLKKLRKLIRTITKTAHPDFTREERKAIASQLLNESILTEKEWEEFYENYHCQSGIDKLLEVNRDKINKPWLSAAYRCFLERSDTVTRRKQNDQMFEFHKVTAEQKQFLYDAVEFYDQHPSEQENLIIQFSENGALKNKLVKKDLLSQKIQTTVMQAFNLERVKNALIETYHDDQVVSPYFQNANLKLPLEDKESEQLLAKKRKIQEDIAKANEIILALQTEIAELKSDTNLFNTTDIAEIQADIEKLKASIKHAKTMELLLKLNSSKLSHLHSYPNKIIESENILSHKDKAHNSWRLFATRELTHQFLSIAEVSGVFKIYEKFPVLQKMTDIQTQLANFKKSALSLMQQCDHQHIDEFYEMYKTLKIFLIVALKGKKYPPNLLIILENFTNVMMNTAFNKTLDQIKENQLENPLSLSKGIAAWLLTVSEVKSDFRSLLNQQFDQPFVHLTLLRQAYIIDQLEKIQKITNSDHRIRKTGLQKLLRVHYLENNTVKRNGSTHYETRHMNDFEEYLKSRGIDNSPTFHYANSRIKMKLDIFTNRNQFSKNQNFTLDTFISGKRNK